MSNIDIIGRAYKLGYANGREAARHTVPRVGQPLDFEGMEPCVTFMNIKEAHAALAWEAEMSARCFSPFEIVASEFNALGEGDAETPSSEEAWDAYEAGVADGIRDIIATHDYDTP